MEQQEEITTFLLSHLLRGGYCPEDLDGKVIKPLSGELLGQEFLLGFERDPNKPDDIIIDLKFGTNQSKYRATFVATACHSALYFLETLLIPWETENETVKAPRLSIEYLSQLPQISSQEELIGIEYSCNSDSERGTLSTSESDDSLSAGAIAGIVIGSVCGLALLALATFVLRRKKHGAPNMNGNNIEKRAQVTPEKSDVGLKLLTTSFPGISENSITEWSDVVVAQDDIIYDRDPESNKKILLGAGKYGHVYRARLFGVDQIAVKCIEDDTLVQLRPNQQQPSSNSHSDDSLKSQPVVSMSHRNIAKEAALLQSCKSQFIVSFIGVSFKEHEVQLITELMPAGDLWNALRHGLLSWYSGYVLMIA